MCRVVDKLHNTLRGFKESCFLEGYSWQLRNCLLKSQIYAKTQEKKLIFHPRMLPAKVILDPVLTVDLPPALTAATGMDALSHNLEAFCAPGFHPMAEGIAQEGIRLVFEHLPTAVAQGDDLCARGQMLKRSALTRCRTSSLAGISLRLITQWRATTRNFTRALLPT